MGLGPETLDVFQTPAFWDRAPGLGKNVVSQVLWNPCELEDCTPFFATRCVLEALPASYRDSPFGKMLLLLGVWRLGRSLDYMCTPQSCSPEEAGGSALPHLCSPA